MLILNTTFKLTAEQETGKWIPFGGGCEFLIASASSPKFQAAVRRTQADHAVAIKFNTLTPEEEEKLYGQAMAEHIVLGWKGLAELVDGKPVEVPYSKEKAKEVLEKYPALREQIAKIAQDAKTFRENFEAEAIETLKND